MENRREIRRKKVKVLSRLLYLIPLLVILFEYLAVSLALVYARFAVEPEQPVVGLLGGIIRVGENLSYNAVPNTVVMLHLLALLLSVLYLIYFFIFSLPAGQDREPVPPPEG